MALLVVRCGNRAVQGDDGKRIVTELEKLTVAQEAPFCA
jgi:hypothetical protein